VDEGAAVAEDGDVAGGAEAGGVVVMEVAEGDGIVGVGVGVGVDVDGIGVGVGVGIGAGAGEVAGVVATGDWTTLPINARWLKWDTLAIAV
jgi:hypothetical protein